MDTDTKCRHSLPMTSEPTILKTWLFWLVFIFWLGTALPIAILSLFLLEVPLWPTFSAESTPEGIAVWTVFAAWFYLTPVALLLVALRKRRPATL